MKFLKKILLVAIIAVFAGNAEGMNPPAQTVFDLPLETPGLVKNGICPLLIKKKILGKKTPCVFIIVPNTVADKRLKADGGNILDSMDCGGNIYFPADGTQPTTPEAVEYSFSNVDNREDSPITEWYMMMFGVIDKDGGSSASDDDYVKAAWDNAGLNAQRIITFDASVNSTMVSDPNILGATISRKALFEREFRKIAANPVGRVLLYRILIEIRRHNNIGEPVLENDPKIVPLLQITNCLMLPEISHCRNNGRRLLIIWNAYNFCYKKINLNHKDISTLEYNSDKIMEQVAMGQVNINDAQIGILVEQMPSNLSSDIFHELLHWFHNLRDPLRSFFEVKGKNSVGEIVKLNDASSLSGYFYAGNDSPTKIQISSLPWLQTDGNKLVINLEEMRTILGAPNEQIFTECTGDYHYLEGDDISENVFRLSQDLPMRLGHKESEYIASNKIFIVAATLSVLTHNTINVSKKDFNIAPVDHVDLKRYPLEGQDCSFFTNMGNVASIRDGVLKLIYEFSF